ncbi:hypothetical protein Hanom_Chr01g00059561 [Helianthus anomalus]
MVTYIQMVSFRFLSKYDTNKRQPKLFIEPSNISKKHYFSLFKQSIRVVHNHFFGFSLVVS